MVYGSGQIFMTWNLKNFKWVQFRSVAGGQASLYLLNLNTFGEKFENIILTLNFTLETDAKHI